MIYLSQLLLNPYNRQVQRELTNPYQLHRTLLKAFGADRSTAGVLHRIEGERSIPGLGRAVALLVQSHTAPDWTALAASANTPYLLASPLVKSVLLQPAVGALLRFRLRANPSRKEPTPNRRNNPRVPLRDDDKRLAWLARKGDLHGFRLLHAAIVGQDYQTDQTGRKGTDGHTLTVESVLFEGVLQVTDQDRFAAALAEGIGPARAFGCGLLSPAPA